MKQNIIRFSVSLPQDLLNALDARLSGYSSRSEIMRDMIREKLSQESWNDDTTDGIAVLSIIYDHHQRELNARMIEIQHDSTHNGKLEILCNTHVHLDHNNCLESIILRGRKDNIEALSTQISGLKGVKYANLARAAL